MASWVFGNRYRWKVCQGQYVAKRLDNEKRTPLVEVMCECTHGENAGQRVKYTGYINSTKNAARTLKDLRAMGYRGKSWGDWSGMANGQEFEAAVMPEHGSNGKTYPRVAFPGPVKRVNTDGAMQDKELERFNDGALGDFAALERLAAEESNVEPIPVDDDDDFPPA